MPKYLSFDGERIVNADIIKTKGQMGQTLVWLVDKGRNILNTEPLCIIYEEYFPWFFDWLKKKFEEDREKESNNA